jgi:hypothetical protein
MERVEVSNFGSKSQQDSQLFAAALENLEQLKAGYPGKAIAMDGDLFITTNNVNILMLFDIPSSLLCVCIFRILQTAIENRIGVKKSF